MNQPLIPFGLQLASCSVLALLVAWVLHLIRGQRLGLRESLLWLVSTLAALLLVAFPGALKTLAELAGVRVPSNALFALAFLYVIVNLLSLTLANSRTAAHTRRLTQECALLRAEIAECRTAALASRARSDGK
jgi:hypothetical protein